MRIFANMSEMMNEVRRDLHELGTLVHPQTMQDLNVAGDPDYATLELSPYGFMIINGSDRASVLEAMGGNLEWLNAEFRERMGLAVCETERGNYNPGEAWTLRRETWGRFIHDGVFAYTYAERFNRNLASDDSPEWESILSGLLHELTEHPDTRQAILPMFDGMTDLPNMGGKARIPCTMHYQFLRRQHGLDVIYVMRSSDFNTHFMYDIALALELQAYFAKLLNSRVGRLTFFTGSLHLYKKDADPGVF